MCKRKVLLIEPNYKNKYPPMGLMKIATYYRMRGDDVRFFKGEMKDLASQLLYEEMLPKLNKYNPNYLWKKHYNEFCSFIKIGRFNDIPDNIKEDEGAFNIIKEYRKKYKNKEFFKNPPFDKVGITTLFTFYWKKTIDTINFAKKLCKNENDVMVGGIMSSLLPNEVYEATGIRPYVGLLNKPGVIDEGDDKIIDQLPLDYSILDEIDYSYPAQDAYFSYMTRGCINKCKFCAVPKLEPDYCDFISLSKQIEYTNNRFGTQKDLLLLDNNVLASKCYNQIIDEIKACGFGKESKYISPNLYEIVINNLKDGYNDRAYIKKMIKIYNFINDKLDENTEEKIIFINKLKEENCLNWYTAEKENILKLEEFVREYYDKIFIPSKRKRIVDFNQGIDSRLITEENMKKLSEINIKPLRIAFDHWKLHDIYEKAIRISVKCGIKDLSNYLLYNFEDKPEELYYRLRMNVYLCEELNANIYSFPMKYHPLNDPEYFKNRDYIGKYWNRKFIRAVQAILNATKGKVGKGVNFFEEAYGKDINEFFRILWMPEAFIIYRRKYDSVFRSKLGNKYPSLPDDCDLANEWWEDFNSLNDEQLKIAKNIISNNKFGTKDYICNDEKIEKVLSYYKITR